MKLSRKRKKELKRLRSDAETLWQEQQEVLDHASAVVRKASKQANLLAHEHVVPRVKTTYEDRLKPGVDRGVEVTRAVAATAKDKVVGDILPALAGVIGSGLSVLEISKDVRARLDKVSGTAAKKAKSFTKAVEKHTPKKKTGPGAGTYVLITLGIVTLAGIAYAAWQTFRADDDLWIADDEPEATGSTNPNDVPKTPTA